MSLRLRSLLPLLVAVASGCGGSSSETPPPLEPLPVNLHYDRSSTALSGEVPALESDAGAAVVRTNELPPEGAEQSAPARSTWGTERSGGAPLK
ncbi:MAG TPA: hypothetical protein VFZ53_34335 [Polyangiaceae bacterium]